jgi:BD-FAE
MHAFAAWALRLCGWTSLTTFFIIYWSIAYSSIGLILWEIAGLWTFWAVSLPVILWIAAWLALALCAFFLGGKDPDTFLGKVHGVAERWTTLADQENGGNDGLKRPLPCPRVSCAPKPLLCHCFGSCCRHAGEDDDEWTDDALDRPRCQPHPCSIWFLILLVLVSWQSWAYTPELAVGGHLAAWRDIIESAVPGSESDRELPAPWANLLATGFSSSAYLAGAPFRGPYEFNDTGRVDYGSHEANWFQAWLPSGDALDEAAMEALERAGGLPGDGSGVPAILGIHGGTNVEYVSADKYWRFGEQLASLGIPFFSLEYRAKARDDGSFFDSASDVRAALAYIRASSNTWRIGTGGKGPPISLNKIFILGGSRGGHLATTCAWSGAQNNSFWRSNAGNFNETQLKVRGVVDIFGATLPLYDEELAPGLIELDEKILGKLDKDNATSLELYQQASANFLFR